ncbi:MAG: hypothetical protein INR73_18600 [Williamsia sp.]|nr:hypothetical protein [Williamsia sp.]
MNPQHLFHRKEKRDLLPPYPTPMQQLCYYLLLFASLLFCFPGSAQQEKLQEEQGWQLKHKADTAYFNMPSLLEGHNLLKQKWERYTRIIQKKGIRQRDLPFTPAFALHRTVVYDSNQCWIGMQGRGTQTKYLLILFPAGRNTVYNTGDATNNFKEALRDIRECTVIVLTYLTGSRPGQQATCYTVTGEKIPRLAVYVQNFEKYLKELKLEKDFPYTFKFAFHKNTQSKMAYILATSHKIRNKAQANNQPGSYFLQAAQTHGEDDNYVELEALYADLCCQSPPRS